MEEKVAASARIAQIDAVAKALSCADQLRLLGRYDALLSEVQELIRAAEAEIQRKQNALLATRGAEVKELHDLLHPGSNVGFEAMEPATDAMKLHATSFGVRMAAAANLSECQLNCLGLAMWLMRATTPGSPFGFIVLDDPVQSMDDIHSHAFMGTVVPHLLDQTGKQLIILSHVHYITEKLRDLNPDRQLAYYTIRDYSASGPDIVPHEKRRRLLSRIKHSVRGNDEHRAGAVKDLRILAEAVIRELYLIKVGSPPPQEYENGGHGKLLELFLRIPDTTRTEHANLTALFDFCGPNHHDQYGHAVPLQAHIMPHLQKLETLMNRSGIT